MQPEPSKPRSTNCTRSSSTNGVNAGTQGSSANPGLFSGLYCAESDSRNPGLNPGFSTGGNLSEVRFIVGG